MTDRYTPLHTLVGLFSVLLLVAVASPRAGAVPVKFFGQDTTTSNSVPAGGAAETARAAFFDNLASVSTESFETFTASSSVPASGSGVKSVGPLTFNGAAGTFTGTAFAQDGDVVSSSTGGGALTSGGIYPTDGSQMLFSRGSIRIDFDTGVSAFGFYVNDVETYTTITLSLRPVGGATDGSQDVQLRYGGIVNSGTAGATPGNAQLNFVGFIDKETQYERVFVTFADPTLGTEPSSAEGFGFDQLTVGVVEQVTTEQATVQLTDVCQNPGWRLLSAPVQGVNVKALALQNLVQGVPAGNGIPQQQYPDAAPNLFNDYGGSGRYDYAPVATTGTELLPGEGFWWYWYDFDANPPNDTLGGGTSESVVLTNFSLTALGDTFTTNVTRQFIDNDNPTPGVDGDGNQLSADDDFYMVGNPFHTPFELASLSATGGTLQSAFYAWDPCTPVGSGQNPDGTPDEGGSVPALDGPGTYVLLTTDGAMGTPTAVNTWQGFMAEVSTPAPAGGVIEFTYATSGKNASLDPAFYGRRAPGAFVHFRLGGTTDTGARVRDEAAYVRFSDEAGFGWDRHDLSKPLAPTATYALLAPVGERDGEPYRQGVLSLPTEAGSLVTPLAFTANEAGTFTIEWTASAVTATLVDRQTGARTDLVEGGSYAFEAAPTDWTERFEVQFASAAVAGEDGPAGSFVGTPFPNPTTGGASLEVRLVEAGEVAVAIFDALGRQVREVRSGVVAAGSALALSVPTEGLAPGAYQVRVSGPSVSAVRSLTVLR